MNFHASAFPTIFFPLPSPLSPFSACCREALQLEEHTVAILKRSLRIFKTPRIVKCSHKREIGTLYADFNSTERLSPPQFGLSATGVLIEHTQLCMRAFVFFGSFRLQRTDFHDLSSIRGSRSARPEAAVDQFSEDIIARPWHVELKTTILRA